MFDAKDFGISIPRAARFGAAIAVIGVLAACHPPARDGGYNRGNDRGSARQADRWDWRDVQGMWCFGNSTNEFYFQNNGRTLIAQPINRRGGAATYRFGGRGVYTEVTGRRRGTYPLLLAQRGRVALQRQPQSRHPPVALLTASPEPSRFSVPSLRRADRVRRNGRARWKLQPAGRP